MKDALTRVFTSAKVWTAIVGLVFTLGASLVAKYGIDASDAAISQIAITVSAIFGILLGAQGATDHGKEKAKIEANKPAQFSSLAIKGELLETTETVPSTPGGAV